MKNDRQFWSEQLSLWKESGLSIKKYCQREGLIEHNFYNWKRKLSKEKTSDFIQAVDSRKTSLFSVSLSSGMTLSFESLPDAHWLGNFIRECSRDSQSQ